MHRSIRVSIVAVALAALSGCGGGGGGGDSASVSVSALSLSTSSLSFIAAVGTTSATQTVTLTNSGSVSLTLGAIAVDSSLFTQSNDCGGSLASGASCTVTLGFTPSAEGSASGALTITSSAASSPDSVSLAGTGTSASASTAGIECAYSESYYVASINLTSSANWSCTGTNRLLTGNGIPDHEVGTFPNAGNPNTITAQSVSFSAPLSPALATADSTDLHIIGYALNSVKFDPATNGTCPSSATASSSCSLNGGSGTWNIEALGQSTFDFGVDSNNAHVQPNGAYHYHGIPVGMLQNAGATDGSMKMVLLGWANDGFPIYGPYGHSSALDASSSLKIITGSYQLKSTPDAGRPSTSLFPMGTFTQDYEYVAGSGDLDECNGRFDVTPEFPDGVYHYYATENSYPYLPRCLRGSYSQ